MTSPNCSQPDRMITRRHDFAKYLRKTENNLQVKPPAAISHVISSSRKSNFPEIFSKHSTEMSVKKEKTLDCVTCCLSGVCSLTCNPGETPFDFLLILIFSRGYRRLTNLLSMNGKRELLNYVLRTVF